jgi:hypothetical protein
VTDSQWTGIGQSLAMLEQLVRAKARQSHAFWGSSRRKFWDGIADELARLAEEFVQASTALEARCASLAETLAMRLADLDQDRELEQAVAATRQARLEFSISRLFESFEKVQQIPPMPIGPSSIAAPSQGGAFPAGLPEALTSLDIPAGSLALIGSADPALSKGLEPLGHAIHWMPLEQLSDSSRSYAGIFVPLADGHPPQQLEQAVHAAVGCLVAGGLIALAGYRPDRMSGIARGGPWRHRPADLLALLAREGFEAPCLEELDPRADTPDLRLDEALDPATRAALESVSLELRGLGLLLRGPGAYLLSARRARSSPPVR